MVLGAESTKREIPDKLEPINPMTSIALEFGQYSEATKIYHPNSTLKMLDAPQVFLTGPTPRPVTLTKEFLRCFKDDTYWKPKKLFLHGFPLPLFFSQTRRFSDY